MPINHAHLRAFHAVASQGSFTRAAATLHVTQPTLSGQVKELEERYGVKLFERRSRGIELTGLGQALLEITQRQFTLEAEAEQLLATARGLLRGQLRVGADAPYHVIPLLSIFNKRYPGIQLSMNFGNSEQVLQDLLHRHHDIAVLPDIQPDSRLHAVPFRRDQLVVFVHKGHPWSKRRSIRLQELASRRLVLRERGSTTRAIFERTMKQMDIPLHEVLEIGSREAVREAVAAGLGIGVVFESEFGRDDRLHKLMVRDSLLEGVEYAACLQERYSLHMVRVFFELLPKLDAR